MPAVRPAVTFVGQHRQGRADLATGIGGVDDGIDESSLGGHIGIEQTLRVVRLERRSLVRIGVATQDRRRLAGAVAT